MIKLDIKGCTVLIDEEDYEKVIALNWFITSHGYAKMTRRKDKHYLHHFIIGKGENGLVVDHINQNKLDNRKENLRHVTRKVNNENKPMKKEYVYYCKDKNRVKRWIVRIKGKYIGRYLTEEEAIQTKNKLTQLEE